MLKALRALIYETLKNNSKKILIRKDIYKKTNYSFSHIWNASYFMLNANYSEDSDELIMSEFDLSAQNPHSVKIRINVFRVNTFSFFLMSNIAFYRINIGEWTMNKEAEYI